MAKSGIAVLKMQRTQALHAIAELATGRHASPVYAKMDMKQRITPVPNGMIEMIGATQCTERNVVRPNTSRPMTVRNAPSMLGNKRSSGGGLPLYRSSARLYRRFQYGIDATAMDSPTRIPVNDWCNVVSQSFRICEKVVEQKDAQGRIATH